jgi:hypothetical protein
VKKPQAVCNLRPPRRDVAYPDLPARAHRPLISELARKSQGTVRGAKAEVDRQCEVTRQSSVRKWCLAGDPLTVLITGVMSRICGREIRGLRENKRL